MSEGCSLRRHPSTSVSAVIFTMPSSLGYSLAGAAAVYKRPPSEPSSASLPPLTSFHPLISALSVHTILSRGLSLSCTYASSSLSLLILRYRLSPTAGSSTSPSALSA
ncbi:hypothetical protein BJX96DRAFT_35938 [Aspergillus floccosus]